MWAFVLSRKFGERRQGQEQRPGQAVSHEAMPRAPA